MPSVSYCCIFKNEEKHLPKWIECAKAVANEEGDEIIACDTGSTDNSCQILRKAGIEPIYFEWADDFSKAKNFVIDKAKGDWIIFMDCDEYFDDKSIPIVRKTITEADPTKTMIIQSAMHNINEDDNNNLISTCVHQRIFRNDPQIRYYKAIHEYVKYFGEGPTIVGFCDLVILHTGYSSSLAKSKGERNLVFLQEEIAENETDELTTMQAFYMANTYAQIGDVQKAAEYADLAVQGPDEELGVMTVKMYKHLISREELKKGGPDFDVIMDLLDRALLRVPEQPDFLIDKARYYRTKNRYYEVEQFCIRALNAMGNEKIMERCESNANSLRHLVYELLAEMQFHKGNIIEARRFITLALQEKPHALKYWGDFIKYFRHEPLSIIKPVMEAINPEPTKEDKDTWREIFRFTSYGDVYLHYAKPKSNTFENHMCKGLYAKAVKYCEKELMELFKYAAFARAAFPKETEILNAVVPQKYLKGQKKQPKGEMNLEMLIEKFIAALSKLIMACFSMTEEEFEKNKNVLNYMVTPAKDFLLAGFDQAEQGIQLSDTKKFYECIAPLCNADCLKRLAKVIYVMPKDDEFLYQVIKELVTYHDLQSAYNLSEKLEDKNYNYYLIKGVIFLRANDLPKARENLIKARALGADGQELIDFIKLSDPSQNIIVNL